MDKLSSLSIFFPAFNEEKNIEEMVKQALQVLPTVAKKFEIIIVNDGSIDQTAQIARRLSKVNKVVYSYNLKNMGYGGALKKGFDKCNYDWVFFTDSDQQFRLQELKKLVKHADKFKLIIGFRKNRAEGFKRHLLAQALKWRNRLWLGFPADIKDIDCAYKLIHRHVLTQVLPLKSNGAMVSTELLLKAHQNDIPYKQVGVKHYLRPEGSPTGSNYQVIYKAIKDTFMLRRTLRL